MADTKKAAPKTDSEGLKVATTHDEVAEEEPAGQSAAKEAFEAEVEADAEDARKTEEFNKFLADRA